MDANEIIIRPLLTEKSYSGISNKVYGFIVNKNANKVEIAHAVESKHSYCKGSQKITKHKTGKNCWQNK